MMKSNVLLCYPLWMVSVMFAYAAEVIYPTLAPGANPAVVPAPRSEWHSMVQKKFDLFGGKHFDIVFDGDSITNRWQTTGREEWDRRYAKIAADFGIEGDLVENVLWRLSKGQVDGINPKLVVLMIGTNNVSRNNTPEQIAKGIQMLVEDYKQRCPNAHIALMGVFPRSRNAADDARQAVSAINARIASLADNQRVTFVDISAKLSNPDGTIAPEMMPDFLHPAAPGYTIWAEALEPLVQKYVGNVATPLRLLLPPSR